MARGSTSSRDSELQSQLEEVQLQTKGIADFVG